ncbi:MAG: stage III sporulation protein AE [Peptococcaceae bacterium]|nr:stage III sporulation protein AE [Peptococcaceae bacterium]
MLKRYLALAIFLLYLFPAAASGGQATAGEQQQEEALDFFSIQQYIDQLDKEVQVAVPEFDFRNMFEQLVKGEIKWQPVDIINTLLRQLFKEVVANLDLLGKLVMLAVICAVLQNMMSSFEKSSTAQLANSIAYLLLITIAIGSFSLAVNAGREVVNNMVSFMQVLTPVLLTMLVAVGGVASATIFSPVVMVTLNIFGTLIKDIVLPLLFFVAVLGIAGNLTSHLKVSGLADLLKSVAMGLTGVFSTVFLGVLTIQGVAGAVGDSLTFKTAKYSVDAFVPVVGGMLSDALEAVVGSSLLIKNALGIAGVAVILSILAVPLLKIITLAFIYKLAGALIQPVNDDQMVSCLNSLSNNLFLVFAAVATTGLLFFFTITILVGIGNINVMLH